MKSGLRTDWTGFSLMMIVSASLIVICTGCIHPRMPIRGTYAIENEAGWPFLVPSLNSLHKEGNTQTVLVALKDGPLRSKAGERCSIASAFFGLSPKDGDSGRWQLRSLTASAWAAERSDIYEDWKQFLQRLASPEYSGCFSTDGDVPSIQRMLASAIPLPATEIDAFLYSNDKAGFVNLAPAMELLIRSKPKPEEVRDDCSDAQLRIEARKTGGAQIKQVSRSRAEPGSKSGSCWHIASRYASVRFFRLFLQGISDYDSQHSPLLLGAPDVQSLDVATRAVQSSGRTSCAGVRPTVICTVISNGASASLLIPIWLNGHRAEYPLGTHLGLLLAQLSSAEAQTALQSLRVDRPVPNGGFARIEFPRTSDSVIQVILLAGDRISWSSAPR